MTFHIWPFARRLVATMTCLLGLALCAQAQEPARSCLLEEVTRLPLNEFAGWFTITASINNHPTVMLVDTAAAHSAISPELAKQLRLPQDRHAKIVVHGVGGELKAAHPVIAHSFRAGRGDLVDYELMVANIASAARRGEPGVPEAVLGLDLLSYYELEFDFPNRTLTLYTSDNCHGNFVPWAGHFDAIGGRRQLDGQLFIPVRLNKEAINAAVDTGANRSAIGIDTAHEVGVPEGELQLDHATNAVGASGVPGRAYEHRFDSVTVGETTFHQVPLFIQNEKFGVTQMLLGMDFFRQRKVWVSLKTEQVFLQSAPVPRVQPARP